MTIGGARTFVSQAWTKDSGDRLWFEVVHLVVSVFLCQRCLSLIVAWGSGQSGTLGRIFFFLGLSRTHISDLDRCLLVLSNWLADIMRNGIAVLVPFELLVWCSRVDLRVALTRWRLFLQILDCFGFPLRRLVSNYGLLRGLGGCDCNCDFIDVSDGGTGICCAYTFCAHFG